MSPLALAAIILAFLLIPIHLGVYLFAYSYCGRGRAWLRFYILIAALVLLTVVGYQWNQLSGAISLPLLALAFFLASIGLASQSLFPVATWDDRFKATRLLFAYIFDSHRDSYLIDQKVERRVAGHSSSRLGTGVILVGVAKAAVMQTAVRFSRIVGSGVHFIHRSEQVKSAVDLHHQFRSTLVQASTKDAVPIRATVFCVFRIAPGIAPTPKGNEFGFSEERIRQVLFNQEGVDERNQEYTWDDYVVQVVVARFREIMGRFRLDQLFAPDDPDQVPRLMLTSTLNTAVRNDLDKRGIELVLAGFGTLSFDQSVREQILEQRIDSWKAQWDARVAGRLAAGEAEAQRLRQEARAAAQWELVQGMINGLEAARGLADINPADLVTWQLLNAVESMSADPAIQPLIPQETMNALVNIRSWLEEKD